MTDLEVAFDWLGDPQKIEAFKKIRFKKHARLKNVPWTAEEKKQVGTWPGRISPNKLTPRPNFYHEGEKVEVIYKNKNSKAKPQELWEKWLLERGLLEQWLLEK